MTPILILFIILSGCETKTIEQSVKNTSAADFKSLNVTGAPDNNQKTAGSFADPGLLGSGISQYLFSAIGRGATLNCTISSGALSDTMILIGMLQNPGTAMSVLQYIDASSKIPSGIFEGHFQWVGEYTECVERIEPMHNPVTQTYFKGKYFTVTVATNGTGFLPHRIVAPRGNEIKMGVCLPDSYTAEDTKCALNMAFTFLESLNQTASILKPLKLRVSKVYTDEGEEFDGGAITALVISGIIVVFILAGTVTDLVLSYMEKETTLIRSGEGSKRDATETDNEPTVFETEEPSGLLEHNRTGRMTERWNIVKQSIFRVMRAFSFIKNVQKLLNTSTAKGSLACLNGMRVLSMWWIILGHVYLYCQAVLDNPWAALPVTSRFTFQVIGNATFSVDTFFFLSGLLVAYLALREVKEKGKLNWIHYFLHRFWRLTPLYSFVLMVYTTLCIHMFGGPFSSMSKSPEARKSYEICKEYWWTNLIYINNFAPNYGSLNGMCMGWTWYLAIDMQCYVLLAPLFIFLLSHRKRSFRLAGIGYALGLVVLCIGLRGGLIGYFGLTSYATQPTRNLGNTFIEKGAMYQRTYTRMSVYMVGMLTGYICHATNCRVKLRKLFVLLGRCISIAVGLAVVYGLYHYSKNIGAKMTITASGFYHSLARTLWSLCLAWIVIACMSGYGGLVNDILSWSVWAPLGRLTFGAYLVHPIVIGFYYFNLLTPLHFTDLTMIYMYIANVVMSYMVAFVVSIAVEAPMMQLEKLIVKRK